MSAVEETPAQNLERVMLSGDEHGTELVMRREDVTGVDAPYTGGELALLYRLAKGLAVSGMFKDAKEASQAFAKLIFGRDLGLSATQAMTGIHIIEGKPEMSANIQAAKVKGSGQYDYRVLRIDGDGCEIEFGPFPAPGKDEETGEWLPWAAAFGVSEFTKTDAEQAKLGGKDNYGKYPRNMYFARAMSNGVAWFCPDVMNGIRVYAEGEIAPPVAIESTAEEGSERDAEDATVVEDDAPLTDEERQELVTSVDAAGVPLDMLLTAVGVDSTDNLTQSGKRAVIAELGKELSKVGAA